jgi:Tfp pilus assembly protein PilO
MADLRNTKKQIFTALIAMGFLSLVSLVVLFSPLAGSAASRDAERAQLANDLREKTREVVPLRGIDDKKMVEVRGQINEFYANRFPSLQSSVSEALGKVAAAHSVKIDIAKYESKADDKKETKDAQAVGLSRVQIEASFSGSYQNMMHFVNDLERTKTFFLVDSVNVGEAQGGDVKLQMKLEAYVKAGA